MKCLVGVYILLEESLHIFIYEEEDLFGKNSGELMMYAITQSSPAYLN